MSQLYVELALGKLLCSTQFRHEFFIDARGALQRQRLKLTKVEFECLRAISEDLIKSVAGHLDPRIRQAAPFEVQPSRMWGRRTS